MKEESQDIHVPKYVIPAGAKLVEAYETSTRIVVMFGDEDIPEDHNCDQMGCGSFSHVKYVFVKP